MNATQRIRSCSDPQLVEDVSISSTSSLFISLSAPLSSASLATSSLSIVILHTYVHMSSVILCSSKCSLTGWSKINSGSERLCVAVCLQLYLAVHLSRCSNLASREEASHQPPSTSLCEQLYPALGLLARQKSAPALDTDSLCNAVFDSMAAYVVTGHMFCCSRPHTFQDS